MNRKIVSLALVLCVLCMMLAGCGKESNKSTYDILHEAMEKNRQLDSMDAEMDVKMKTSVMGMTMEIPMKAHIKAAGMKGSAPVVSTDISMSLMGQNIELQMYIEGNWAYVTAMGQSYKMDAASAQSSYNFSGYSEDMLQDIPEELLKDVQPVKNEDGSMSVTVTVPNEKIDQIYGDLLKSANASQEGVASEISAKDMVVSLTVADGYISKCAVKFNMTATADGMSTETEAEFTVIYNNPGTQVTVTPPEGYKDFEEMKQP